MYACMLASLYVMNNYRYQPNKHIVTVTTLHTQLLMTVPNKYQNICM